MEDEKQKLDALRVLAAKGFHEEIMLDREAHIRNQNNVFGPIYPAFKRSTISGGTFAGPESENQTVATRSG